MQVRPTKFVSLYFQGKYDLRLMYGIFALMGLLGAVAASFLPETFKTDLPDTIKDIDKRPKYPYFSWRVWDAVPTSEI